MYTVNVHHNIVHIAGPGPSPLATLIRVAELILHWKGAPESTYSQRMLERSSYSGRVHARRRTSSSFNMIDSIVVQYRTRTDRIRREDFYNSASIELVTTTMSAY
jgi:hypothetical protein